MVCVFITACARCSAACAMLGMCPATAARPALQSLTQHVATCGLPVAISYVRCLWGHLALQMLWAVHEPCSCIMFTSAAVLCGTRTAAVQDSVRALHVQDGVVLTPNCSQLHNRRLQYGGVWWISSCSHYMLSCWPSQGPDVSVPSSAIFASIQQLTIEYLDHRGHLLPPLSIQNLCQPHWKCAGHELQFILAPNLHWPDSMFTFDPKTNIMFTCDAFGSHYCTEDPWDTDVDALRPHYRFYYDCLMKPNARSVTTALRKVCDSVLWSMVAIALAICALCCALACCW